MHHTEPNDNQLRYFGASLAALFLVFAALCYWRWEAASIAAALVGIAVMVAVVYYALPSSRRPIYRGFRRLTYPIQVVVTAIVLAIVYFGILTPIGVVLRWRGIDLRKRAPADQSLWVRREEPAEPSSYFRTY